jgi:hypothetical protein
LNEKQPRRPSLGLKDEDHFHDAYSLPNLTVQVIEVTQTEKHEAASSAFDSQNAGRNG